MSYLCSVFKRQYIMNSPILQEAHDSITPQERAAFELNYGISERIRKRSCCRCI